MKIGIEAQRLFRTGKHGMEVVAMELIRQLQLLDQRNQYLVYAKNDKDRSCIPEADNFRIYTPKSISYADWEQLSLPLAIRRTKPDFIHCTANTAPLVCPVPLLLTLHDIIYLEQINMKGSAYQNAGNLYRRFIAPAAIRNARRIITVSAYEKKIIMEKCKVDEEKIRVIHNGVDERFHPSYPEDVLNAFRQEYELPSAFILFLGNTAPKKNAINTIEAYAKYCNNNTSALPLVVTDYERHNVQHILSYLNQDKLISRIILPGYVPSMKMPLLYNCASLFLYPSLRESFGLPILEAMACGVPVITSDTSAMPEIAGGAAMLADPASSSAIALAIDSMLSDTAKCESYRQSGINRAMAFSWKKSAALLLDIYREMYEQR